MDVVFSSIIYFESLYVFPFMNVVISRIIYFEGLGFTRVSVYECGVQ